MMRKIINGIAIIASFLVFTSACEAKTNTNAKFHLVYLVSVMDLKPGSKVYVDPLFFTDGKKIYGFQYYCYGSTTNRKIISNNDITFVNNYCANKSYTMNTSGHYVQNNHGGRVKLKKIRFLARKKSDDTPYMVGKSSIFSLRRNRVQVPVFKRNDGRPEFFYLMSSNQRILNKLMPRTNVSEKEMKLLLKRAKMISPKALEYIWRGTIFQISDEDKIKNKNLKTKSIIYSPLFSDINLDGKADLAMGTSGQSYLNGKFKYAWKAVGYVMGHGEIDFGRASRIVYSQPQEGRKSPVDAGYTLGVPLLFLRLDNCNYILRYVMGGGLKQPEKLLLENTRFPLGYGSGCQDKVIFRNEPES